MVFCWIGRSGGILSDVPGVASTEVKSMLWTIVVVLLILWLLGFSLHVGGGLIHIVLLIAMIFLIFSLISGRRSA
jgi:Family of unknown function (DUF5670)